MIAATPPVALSVSPPRVSVAAGGRAEFAVTNFGRTAAVVELGAARFALTLRGRPEIRGGSTPGWLRVGQRRIVLGPSQTVDVPVAASATLAPGDHAALIVLRTRGTGSIAVRVQVGVVVVARGSGRVVHRLTLRRVRVLRRSLELTVFNSGNVAERGFVVRRGGRVLGRLQRELLPRSAGIFTVPRRGRGRLEVAVLRR